VKIVEQLAELAPVDERRQLGGVKPPHGEPIGKVAGSPHSQETVPVGGSENGGGTGKRLLTVAVHLVDL